MSLPGVSMLCLTYNKCPHRQWLIEEAIEGFLRQDYEGPKEFLIINDHPEQKLICDKPDVRVINHPYRFANLGAKRNFSIEQAKYDLLACADDDDISLPNRLRVLVNKITVGNYDYYNPKAYWFLFAGVKLQAEKLTGYAQTCGIFTRDAWIKAGGYPENNQEDAGMDSRLRAKCRFLDGPLSTEDTNYIVRWGVSNHFSGNNDVNTAYERYGKDKCVPGEYILKPFWQVDYTYLTRSIINLSKKAQQSWLT